MNCLKTALLCCILSCLGTGLSAQQKFAYVNVGNILESIPAVGKADTLLVSYRDSLVAIGLSKRDTLEMKYAKYMEDSQQGILTPIQANTIETELKARQTELQQYESLVQNAVAEKREKLLQPILDRINEAIQTIGKEGKYSMIFDASMGQMLYATPAEDISELVRKSLKI